MPDYSYAIISALLWAISSPVLNMGLVNLPDKNKYVSVLFGIFTAMLSGTVFLYFFTTNNLPQVGIDKHIVLAGIFTYPIATGLYYLSAYSFGSRTELASQFAKVKPLISLIFAVVILKETIDQSSLFSALLIVIGVLLLSTVKSNNKFTKTAVILGLFTATSWAIGEVFVKISFHEKTIIDQTFMALLSSLVFTSIIVCPFLFTYKNIIQVNWIMPFFLHGILSFAIAYSCFFKSISLIGLSDTILINSFWPLLALLFASIIKRIRNEPYAIEKKVILAAILLLSASLLEISTQLQG